MMTPADLRKAILNTEASIANTRADDPRQAEYRVHLTRLLAVEIEMAHDAVPLSLPVRDAMLMLIHSVHDATRPRPTPEQIASLLRYFEDRLYGPLARQRA